MEISSEKYIERLIQASNEKVVLLKEIYAVTVNQEKAIDADEAEELLELLSKRQSIIDKINAVDEKFEVYFGRLKSTLGIKDLNELKDVSPQAIKELQDCIEIIMKILMEIKEVENRNHIKAKNLMNKISNELKMINQSKKVNSAYGYGNSIQPSAVFLDKKK